MSTHGGGLYPENSRALAAASKGLAVLEDPHPFSIAAAQGVTLTKWTRAWQERHSDVPLTVIRTTDDTQIRVLHDAEADVSFVRFPIDDERLSVIPLYVEVPVVVLPKDHPLSGRDALTVADLAGENHLAGDWESAIELVAANVGVVVVPQSIARLHNRKDVEMRPVTDAPQTRIAMVWLTEKTTEFVEEFIGIVRGRTAHSSRTTPTPPSSPAAARAKKIQPPRKKENQPGRTRSVRRPKRGGR